MTNLSSFEADKLWNRSFIFACLANFLAFTTMYYLTATLPLYATEFLGGTKRDVGFLFGLFAFAGVIARPFAGRILDTSGRTKTAWLSLIFLFFAMLAYTWTTALFSLFVLRIFHGVCWGFSSTALATAATDAIPVKKRGEGIGYYGLSMSFAMLLGPWLGLSVLHKFTYTPLFYLGAFLALASCLCLFEIKSDRVAHQRKANDWIEKSILAYAGIVFFIAFNYSSVLSFIVLFAQELSLENSSLFFLANAVGVIVSRPYSGKILDKKGPLTIMCFGFAAFLTAFVCLFFTHNDLLFLTAALLLGIGFGIIYSLAFALSINKVDASRRGSVNGTLLTAFDLGFALGALLLGQLSGQIGLRSIYLLCSFLTLLPFAIFYRKHMRSRICTALPKKEFVE